MKKRNNYQIKCFEKIVSILRLFSENTPELDFKEIQLQMGFNKTTLHRLMANLVEQELLVHDSPYRKYKLGPLLLRLGFTAWHSFQLRDITTPFLKDLSARTGKTVHLAQRIGKEILYVDRHEGEEGLTVKSRIGMTRPLHSTALGKVLCAYLDRDELEKLIEDFEFKPFTKNTIIGPQGFMDELEKVRLKGYAVDRGEHNVNVSCVAVPVRATSKTVIAAISIAGPYFHFNARSIRKYAREAQRTAMEISRELEKNNISL